MGELMSKIKEIREIVKSFDKDEKLFIRYVDSILRNYDLLKSEYIDSKWIILMDIKEKLSTVKSVWDIYENPKLFCESVVSKYQRKNIGNKGRLVIRILPIYFFNIIILFLLISPNGIYQLFNLSNPGILLSVGMITYIIFLGFNFFVPYIFEDKNLFVRKPKLNIFSWIIIILYFMMFIYIQSLKLSEFIPMYVHPLVLCACLILLCFYFIVNRKKLFF